VETLTESKYETVADDADAGEATEPGPEAAPVSVEINHRGDVGNAPVVHIDGQQVFDVDSVDISLDPTGGADVVVTLTRSGGETTAMRVTRLDIVGEAVED
jgi:hypothetical protein